MKVGIVTIIDNNNYGNRLQNYAVQKELESLGHEVITLDNRAVLNMQRSYLYKKIRYKDMNDGYSINVDRRNSFKAFNEYINISDSIITPFSKCREFDYVVCGSDQVWNPYFGVSDVTLLKSISDKKRIAYSASFGVEIIPERMINYYSRQLSKFKSISVREDSAVGIIKKLTGNDAEVLVDPTMMLSKEEWSIVSKKPLKMDLDKPYLLLYFLGGVDNYRDRIFQIARENNYLIYDILDKNSLAFATGPSEFIYLIQNASLIITDSFHASVFSIIFHKNVMIYERKAKTSGMESRIETLLKKFAFDITEKGNYEEFFLKADDYRYVDEMIIKEQEKTKEFLVSSIN